MGEVQRKKSRFRRDIVKINVILAGEEREWRVPDSSTGELSLGCNSYRWSPLVGTCVSNAHSVPAGVQRFYDKQEGVSVRLAVNSPC